MGVEQRLEPGQALDHIDRIVAQVEAERPELDTVTVELIGRISRLARVVDDSMSDSVAPFGLSAADLRVLVAMRRAGRPFQLTPSQLQRSLMSSSGGLTYRLDQLERRGLIARLQDSRDRRSVPVALTAHGRRVVDEAWDVQLRHDRALFEPLTEDERRALADLLRRLLLAAEGPE